MCRMNESINRKHKNPRRLAALKAVRKAMDMGVRPAPNMIALRDGQRCPATGLIRHSGGWYSFYEYATITGIDG